MFSSEKLLEVLQLHLKKKPKRLWIAFSGGLDSSVLLHAMQAIQQRVFGFELCAVHINHHLSPYAKHWEQHCQAICQSLNIALKSYSITIPKSSGQSTEAIAREKRYAIFNSLLSSGEFLLTAHHQDDQAETLLIQLFRGCGIQGLAAMPEIKLFGQGYHLRPLLNFTRKQLQIYAQENHLSWIEDESNLNENFDRNFIRHTITPLLKKRWPALTKTLSRAARICAESASILEEVAEDDLKKARGSYSNTLSIHKLLSFNEARQHSLIYYWLRSLNLALPDNNKLKKIFQEVIAASQDAKPLLKWSDVEIRRYGDDLYAMNSLEDIPEKLVVPWEFDHPEKNSILLPYQLGIIVAYKVKNGGIKLEPHDHIEIRFRQGGELCQPQGCKEHHAVKKLLQTWKIPPWLRQRIPFLYINNQLASIMGYCICQPFVANENAISWHFEWHQQ